MTLNNGKHSPDPSDPAVVRGLDVRGCLSKRQTRVFSSPHVLKVREDKGLVDVKATGDDVLGVLHSVAIGLVQGQVLPQVLLVIRHLDDQGHVEHILQPPKQHMGEG